ncbi:hypothetical protein DIPPA_03179 [Diplonema papillatum]|nr:hypothetical protein DIPPA_03179 [Diplonema papillatum]
MQQAVMSRSDLEDSITKIREGENALRQELRDLEESLKDEQSARHLYAESREESIAGRLRVLKTEREALQQQLERRIQLQQQQQQQHHAPAASLVPATNLYDDYPSGEEGVFRERYADELRTTFVGRQDLLLLRLSGNNSVYDSFDNGRADGVHTVTATGSDHHQLTYFRGSRGDGIVSYTRWIEDSCWQFLIRYGPGSAVAERRITLKAGERGWPLRDTLGDFKKRVAAVETICADSGGAPTAELASAGRVQSGCRGAEAEPGTRFKRFQRDYTRRIASVSEVIRQDSAPGFSGAQERGLFSYKLGADRVMESVEHPPELAGARKDAFAAESEAWYEVLLRHEAETVVDVLRMERESNLFLTVHLAGSDNAPEHPSIPRYQDALTDKVSALALCVTELYAALDEHS